MVKLFGLKKMVTSICAALLTLMSLAACSSSKTDGAPAASSDASAVSSGFTVNVGFFTNPNPEKVAKEQGLFEKYTHAKINWVPVESGGTALASMASGSLDFVSAVGNPGLTTAIANKIDFKLIYVNENSAEALVTKADIASIEDLKGKSIGVPFGSTSQFTLMGALGLHKVDSAKVLDMQPQDIVAAWKRGDISAAYVWQPFLSQLIQDGGHVLVTSDEMAKKGYPVFDAVAVNSKFEKEHPDIVEGFVKAEIEGTKYYHEHPDESYALIAKSVGITKQEAEQQSKEYVFPEAKEQISQDWIGTTATKCDATVAKGLSTTASWLVSTNKIQDNSPNYCDAVQPAYVEKYVDSTK